VNQLKVAYRTLGGFVSTAYIDVEHEDSDQGTGEDKYTDEPVTLRWDGQQWREIE
jgi:hypothetical protein